MNRRNETSTGNGGRGCSTDRFSERMPHHLISDAASAGGPESTAQMATEASLIYVFGVPLRSSRSALKHCLQYYARDTRQRLFKVRR